MRKRKHMFSVEEKKFEEKDTGDFMDLGSNLHIKLFLGTAKYFRKMDKFYHEIPVACFEATIKNSRTLDTDKIKINLEVFNARNKRANRRVS